MRRLYRQFRADMADIARTVEGCSSRRRLDLLGIIWSRVLLGIAVAYLCDLFLNLVTNHHIFNVEALALMFAIVILMFDLTIGRELGSVSLHWFVIRNWRKDDVKG